MADWLFAAGFMGVVAGLAGCFVLLLTAAAMWVYEAWTNRRTAKMAAITEPEQVKKCGVCQWYGGAGVTEERIYYASCRRQPPSTYPQEKHRCASWPQVQDTDWCGEFRRYVPEEPV